MKKILLALSMIFGITLGVVGLGATPIFAEENEEVFESNVKIGILENGDILTDIEEGHVGDKVTMKVSPYVFYKVEAVTVNGSTLVANEDGNYEFILVEGENLVEATFVVNKEELSTIAELLANAKTGEWDEIFNLENLTTFISWIITTIMGSGLFITLLKSKKIEAKTAKAFSTEMEGLLNTNFNEICEFFLNDTIKPLLEQYNVKIDTTEETVKVMARCFALSQENTPESRLAIINELTNFKSTTVDLSKQITDIINAEIKKNNDEKEQLNKTIEELKEANEKVSVEKIGEDSYGQF